MPASHFTSPSDPHRWLRRNRYQEGPDFLFLATQNGRPAEQRPSRSVLDAVRLRMRAVRLAMESGVAEAVRTTGCSRASIYRWMQAFENGGIAALAEESRRPHHLRTTVPNWVDTVIIAIRLHTYWNSKRIAAEMERRQLYRVSAKHYDGTPFTDRGFENIPALANLQNWLAATMAAA